MNAEEFTNLVANLGRPGEPEEEAAALQRLIGMARRVNHDPHLPNKAMYVLRCAQADLEGLLDGEDREDGHSGFKTIEEIKEVLAEADPMGPEAASQFMSQEIAGTEVEQPAIICIEIKDGNVQAVYGSREVPVVVLDYDTDYAAEKDLIEVYSEEGVQCLPTVWSVDIAPESVRKTIEALHGHGLWD
ncbi:hypothetical protein DFAR_3060035 [Desulfarculales bacterium]